VASDHKAQAQEDGSLNIEEEDNDDNYDVARRFTTRRRLRRTCSADLRQGEQPGRETVCLIVLQNVSPAFVYSPLFGLSTVRTSVNFLLQEYFGRSL